MKLGMRVGGRGLVAAGAAVLLAGVGAAGASATPLGISAVSEPKLGEVCATTVTSVSDTDCWSGSRTGNLKVTVQAFENDADWHVRDSGGNTVFERLMDEGDTYTFTLLQYQTIVVQDAQGWNDLFDTNGHTLKVIAVSPAWL